MAKGSAAAKIPETAPAEEFEAPIPDNRLADLAALVEASKAPEGFLLIPHDEADAFLTSDPKFADAWEEDGQPVDYNGKYKLHATDAAAEYLAEHPATPSSRYEVGGQPEAAKSGRKSTGFVRPENIEIDTTLAMPTSRRGRSTDGATAYPFDDLEKGTSFHIPATEECPEPAKSVASSVSAANERYLGAEIEGETVDTRRKREDGTWEKTTKPKREVKRHFFTQSVGKEDPRGPGVRVWRDI